MRKKRSVFGWLTGLALVSPGFTPAPAEPAPPRPVWTETLEAEGAPAGLRYSATIQPFNQVSVAFKTTGYVRRVQQRIAPGGAPRMLQQGDAVFRGNELARLDAAEAMERASQARAQLAEAQAVLTRAAADLERARALYQEKALTRPDLDAATAAHDSASARVDSARAQLSTAEIALRDTRLVSPTDGVVLSREVEVGALATAGSVGFVLADLTRVKAVFGVPDQMVDHVPLGSALAVTSDALGGREFAGRVSAVSPAADAQSRVFNVEVTIPNLERQLKAGMIASVEVTPPGAPPIGEGALAVPVSAVVKSSRPDGFAVFVAEGPDHATVARLRDVALGRIAGNRVEVASGLRSGERVIVSGASLLVDGERVRIIPGRQGEL